MMITSIRQRYELGRRRLSVFVIAVSVLAMIGWIFGITIFKSLFPDLPPMNPLTAVLFILFGLVTLYAEKIKERTGVIFYAVLLAISLTRLFSFLWPSFRLDEIVTSSWFGVPRDQGQMAIATALSFSGLAVAAILKSLFLPKFWLRQYILLAVFTIALMSFAGHLFGTGYIEVLGLFSKMALPASILFICLSTAMIFNEPAVGLMEIFTSESESGILVRRIMPWTLALPFIITWFGLLAWRIGWLGFETSAAINVSIIVGVLLVLIWRIALTIEKVEKQKKTIAVKLESHEQELQKFKQAVDAATDAILITNPNGKIIYVNPTWERMTGYSQADVLGQNRTMLQSGENPPEVYDRMWQMIMAGRQFRSDEFINRRKDGTEYAAELHVFPVRSAGKTDYIVQLQQDITERKAVERAKTEFVSLAAHQLTTPLSAISWFSELILDGAGGKLNEQQQHMVKRIEQSNRHMISLVNSLLNSSRIDLGTFAVVPQLTDLKPLVQGEVEESRAGYPDGPQATVTIDGQTPPVSVDQNLFTIIVQNLVTNALRYTPVDGKVAISLGHDKNDVILTVTDTGIGIPIADQAKIFTKLFRSSVASQKEPNGNGLGLYIVKAVIDQGGGSISFKSKPGAGTTFTVRLPLTGMKEREGTRQLTRDL